MTINKAILVGNLGADPETRQTASGTTVANLRIATTERRKDRDGNWSDHTEWHRVVCFGRTAENVAKYCQKGKQVYVEGRISTSEYTDRDGNRRWSTEVVADVVRFLAGGGQSANSGDGRKSGEYGGRYGGETTRSGRDAPPDDDSIPF